MTTDPDTRTPAERVADAAIAANARLITFLSPPFADQASLASGVAELVPDAVLVSVKVITQELRTRGIRTGSGRFEVAYAQLEAALAAGRTVVFDANNHRPKDRRKLLRATADADITKLVVVVRVPAEVTLDRFRAGGSGMNEDMVRAITRRLAGLTVDTLRSEGFDLALELTAP